MERKDDSISLEVMDEIHILEKSWKVFNEQEWIEDQSLVFKSNEGNIYEEQDRGDKRVASR